MAIERQHRPIDKEFEEADYTGVLDISDRKLRIFPNIGDDIHDVLEIFVANLSGNRFDKFPKHILRYSNLVTVNLCHNSLRTVPVEIVYLKELKELKLSRNYIQHLPPSISDMKLQLLAVNNNRLCELPMDIGKMKTLKSLDVSRNDLTELPPSIVDLSQLNYLDIFRNEIRELPEDIHKIPLTYFNISANMLSRIPLSLRRITTLTHFSCDNNPLEWPPAQVCMRGMNHVFKFLHEIEKYGNDPQQFASNRDESLLRRRSNRSKKASRPISDASTLSGSGSEYGERSFIDEMTNFVQSAFGDNDTKIFQSDHSSGRYWSTQHSYSDERTGAGYSSVARARKEEYLSAYNKSGRYRSQSPGPLARQQLPISSSQPGTHYGTLPRTSSNKDVEGDKKAQPNRAPSPDKDRVLRTYMSETSSIAPENKEKKLSKYTSGTSTYNYQSYENQSSNNRPLTPPSREGSVTPTPEDLDEPPQTPKEDKSIYPIPTIAELVEDLSTITDVIGLAQHLNVATNDDSTVSIEDVCTKWLDENPQHTWGEVINALKSMDQLQLATELENKYKISPFITVEENDAVTPSESDIQKTPQHETVSNKEVTKKEVAATTKQVSFSVEVSEVPPLPIDEREDEESPISPTSPCTPNEDVPVEEEKVISPTSPSRPKPIPPPKPDSTTWPRQRASGGPQKRKTDVFKVIGRQDPNFTVRRQQANMQQEIEKIQGVKAEMEALLNVELDDDMGKSISDGVLLCQLVNKLYPNTISNIHLPKNSEPLSAPKQTMNVAAFLAACKKLHVSETVVCTAGEILEYKDPVRVTGCIRGLLDTVTTV